MRRTEPPSLKGAVLTQITTVPAGHIPLKQGVDASILMRVKNKSTGAYAAVGWQLNDRLRMDLREYPGGPVVGRLKGARNFQVTPAVAGENEAITIIFYGEDTIYWSLTAAGRDYSAFAPDLSSGALALPRQSLYGTLYIVDSDGQDRAASGEDLPFSMEISLTEPELLENTEESF